MLALDFEDADIVVATAYFFTHTAAATSIAAKYSDEEVDDQIAITIIGSHLARSSSWD